MTSRCRTPRQSGTALAGATAVPACLHVRVAEVRSRVDASTPSLEPLAAAIRTRNPETFEHCRRVAHYATALAVTSGLTSTECEEVWTAALLHDIGKIAMPDSILRSGSILTAGERHVIETHVEAGWELLNATEQIRSVAELVRCHHERWDGTGYSRGLKGAEIPLGARIITMADAFDAMTSDRPYRPAMPVRLAIGEVLSQSERQFDPELARSFAAMIREWL